MTVVHLLGHYDDEYGALPLIWSFARAGRDQRFFYLTEPDRGAAGSTRRAETEALLRDAGVRAEAVVHVGRDRAIPDRQLFRRLDAAWSAIGQALEGVAPVEQVVTPAWEGGHVDHDMCAVLATALAAAHGGPPPIQFGLYNGLGWAGPLFGAALLTENGPAETLPVSAGDWWRYATAVRFFPSQAPVWSTLWPHMFARFAMRGFCFQRLAPGRTGERPHPGPLLYERRGYADHRALREAADVFLAGRAAPTV